MLFPTLLALTAGLFFFQDNIAERVENRSERFTVSDGDEIEEWRVVETNIALEKYNEGSLLTKLFGNETFNEYNAYKLPFMFHNDFAVLLGSTGLLGIFLYVSFFTKLSLWFKIHLLKISTNFLIYKWMFLSLLIGLIIFGIAGNFKTLGSSFSISLAGLGSIQGLILNNKVDHIK